MRNAQKKQLAIAGLLLGALGALGACGGKPSPGGTTVVPTGGDTGAMTPPPGPGTAPPPADPAPKTEGAFTEAWVHGVHVLVKRIPGSETSVTELGIAGGVRNWSATDAGIERLALAVSVNGGTEKMARDAFTQHLSDLGSTLTSGDTEDYATITAWGLTPSWEETFGMMADAFRHPALPPAQIEVERQRMLAALGQEQDDPDAKLGRLMFDTVFHGHPYANRAEGTIASVKGLTAGQLRTHLDSLRETSRLFLVVVGDVDAQRVIAATTAAFGDLPRGAYANAALPAWRVEHATTTVVEQKLPTNYVMAVAPGPRWGDPDFYAMWVGMNALSTREFSEVRTKRNLSYAPSAFMRVNSGTPMVAMYVTAVDATQTMNVMLGEAKKLRDEPLPPDELDGAKSQFLTATLMGAEDVTGQAANLVISQTLGGDWHLLASLPEHIHAVTAAQIQGWAKKNFTHLQTVVIGDGTKIDRKALESF